MRDRLLIHSCCAPCSSAIIEELYKYFDITLYFYNPCITDAEEYYLRANELKKFCKEMGNKVKLVIADYDPSIYYEVISGFENQPEGGTRCSICFKQRLIGTAKYASEHNFKYFSTTLTISPYKDSAVVNAIGKSCGWSCGVMYMPFDFGYLYTYSLMLCEKYELYQQNYCGCEYSKNSL